LKTAFTKQRIFKTNTGHLPVKMVGVFKHSLFVILKHEMMGPIDVVLEVIETITQKRVSGIATATVKITQHDLKMG
jgi:hypothetical protein